MKTERKEIKRGRAVVLAAVAAMGVGALATPALAIQDNGLMIEENALVLQDKLGGVGEDGLYLDIGAIGNPLKPIYILFHKALITPVWLLGNIPDLRIEGYEDQ
jgi:hypothetical protein